MTDLETLEHRVVQSFMTDLPEMIDLRFERNHAAHAEHKARLTIIDKQLTTLTRDLREMRGSVSRQLMGRDQQLAAIETRLTALESQLAAIRHQSEISESRHAGVQAQLARIVALLEKR